MKLIRFSLVVVLVFQPIRVVGQQSAPQAASQAAVTAPQNLVSQIRKIVGFLVMDYKDGDTSKQITGTCFFVFYPDSRLGPDRGFMYLVTNRHMAVPGAERGQSLPVNSAKVYLNLKNPPAGQQTFVAHGSLAPDQLKWLLPDDASIDLAALNYAPSQETVDYRSISISDIATKEVVESRGVGVGDSVVFAGYFYQWAGNKRIQPIVRQGVLAMLPDDEIKTTLQQFGRLYLADVHAFHGNSGSPLFVNLGGIRGNSIGGASYGLLGVISGYYPEGESFSVPAATVLTGDVRDNSGIATVVPSYELLELLESPKAKADRDSEVTKQKAKP